MIAAGADTADAARAWLKRARQEGEAEVLAAGALAPSFAAFAFEETPLRILAAKHPHRLEAIVRGLATNKRDGELFGLAGAIAGASLPLPTRTALMKELASSCSPTQLRAVLQRLVPLAPADVIELLGPVLESLPADATQPYWLCPEAGWVHVVLLLEDDGIWRAYLRAARRSSVGLRLEMMNPLNYTYVGDKNRARRLAFLRAFLDDEGRRDLGVDPRFSGPCAGFHFPSITVRDHATRLAASILELPDSPDEFWTADQWAALRATVRERLARETLPDLTSPTSR